MIDDPKRSSEATTDLRQLALSNAYSIAALVQVLEEKGFLTADEVTAAVRKLTREQGPGKRGS